MHVQLRVACRNFRTCTLAHNRRAYSERWRHQNTKVDLQWCTRHWISIFTYQIIHHHHMHPIYCTVKNTSYFHTQFSRNWILKSSIYTSLKYRINAFKHNLIIIWMTYFIKITLLLEYRHRLQLYIKGTMLSFEMRSIFAIDMCGVIHSKLSRSCEKSASV